MTMSDIANNAKITLLWRLFIGLCSVTGTALIGVVFGFVKSADSKLSRIDGDVSQIKWELPVIKETAKTDKAEIQKQLETVNIKIENLRESGDMRQQEISKLQLEQALLKQKLQMP